MRAHEIPLRLLMIVLLLTCGGYRAVAAPDARTLDAQSKYESGLAHFNLQEYKEAIVDFEAGYRLKPSSTFLYNIAQAHRLNDNPERALYFYRAFLRSAPDAPNSVEVQARVASLEALLRQRKSVANTPPDQTLPPKAHDAEAAPPPAVTQAPATRATMVSAPEPSAAPKLVAGDVDGRHEHTPVYKKWWLWTGVAVVVAGGAVGLGLGLTAKKSGFSPSVPDLGPGPHAAVRF
ncbi:MAG TPA: hypothetical protein VHB97_02300 [Polyangia bacterium]|jgi:tetratricopeptide (TPR) repeat protein|nr:hypothetical protein [Polyangia bacterium]